MSSFQSSGSVPETIVSTSPAEILQMIAGDGIPECSWMDLFYIGPQDKAIYEELPGVFREPDQQRRPRFCSALTPFTLCSRHFYVTVPFLLKTL
ncbi:Protein of unknown function [Pyronema omphalodes CBS 100304]|uniref:Uncharacterized protein n=1 Tax=Pyronema omphalodes (strain CBS 100304) TaxID=1076935 RepID=U4LL04_PYROM|nr:Protein of unknown function [Pyronema omphalodes CBS 100304]